LVSDIEKLTKQKIDFTVLDLDQERAPARRPREAEEDRPRRTRFTPVAAPVDPFFDKPYEASTPSAAAEASTAATARDISAPSRSGISPNIKPKRTVAALFKTTSE
jgi:hypothetical protein